MTEIDSAIAGSRFRLGDDALVVRRDRDGRSFAMNRHHPGMLLLSDACYAYLRLLSTPGAGAAAAALERRLPRFVEAAAEQEIVVPADGRPTRGRVAQAATSVERLFVELTSACNLRCLHCYGSYTPSDFQHLEYEVLAELVRHAGRLGVHRVDLTGGEPMMHPDFARIPPLLDRAGMVYSVFSNLTHVSDDAVAALGSYRPLQVVTSVESATADVHDRFRGQRGSHARTLRNISVLQGLGIAVTVNVVVGAHNVEHVRSSIAWLRSLRVGVVVDTIHLEGRATADLQIEPARAFELREWLESEIGPSPPDESCGVAGQMVFVDAGGTIRLCPSLRQAQFELGDARHASELHDRIVGLPQRFPQFHGARCRGGCPAGDRCRGGCQARSFRFHGDAGAPDPDMCARYLPLTPVGGDL